MIWTISLWLDFALIKLYFKSWFILGLSWLVLLLVVIEWRILLVDLHRTCTWRARELLFLKRIRSCDVALRHCGLLRWLWGNATAWSFEVASFPCLKITVGLTYRSRLVYQIYVLSPVQTLFAITCGISLLILVRKNSCKLRVAQLNFVLKKAIKIWSYIVKQILESRSDKLKPLFWEWFPVTFFKLKSQQNTGNCHWWVLYFAQLLIYILILDTK